MKVLITNLLIVISCSVFGQNYTYDSYNRLKTVTYSDGSQIRYEYDDLGNRSSYEVIAVKVFLDIKLILSGPYNEAVDLMNDHLRSAAYLPSTEPFSTSGYQHKGIQGGGESIVSQAVLNDNSNNSIVDWVVVELRDKNDINNVLHTRSALLQRDGDVVEMDGSSLVGFFGIQADEYYIAIRHRNHLTISTADPIAISTTTTTFPINFTDGSTQTYGINAQVTLPDGRMGMIPGDANSDGAINAVDRNIYWRIQNGTPFNYLTSTADFNMDGVVNAIDQNLYWRLNNSRTTNVD